MKILDSAGPEVTDAVLQRRAEFGINVVSRRQPELEAITITHDPVVLMCHDDHPLADRVKLRWRELEKYNLVALGRRSGSEAHLGDAVTRLNLEITSTFAAQRASTVLASSLREPARQYCRA